MDEQIETIDSPNDETTEGEPDLDALKKEKDELSGKNKQLFERAKKSESEVKELRDQIKKLTEEKPELDKPQSNEPDYAKIAYLNSTGVIHPDDQKIVQDEAERLKLPLTDVLQMEHLKLKLDTAKAQREAAGGMPKSRGNAGGKTQADVDYWLAKGETPDDLELAEKVIEARMKKDPSNQMFGPLE